MMGLLSINWLNEQLFNCREVRLSLGNAFVSFRSENEDDDSPKKPTT